MESSGDFRLPPLEILISDDERFMRQALLEAKKAYLQDEVPIGAVMVYEGRIIARGFNQVELLHDATAHAEMLAITTAESELAAWRLSGCTLYTTCEPCPMCAGAALLTRVDTIVWGTEDIRHGAGGSWIDLFAKPYPTHTITIRKGILRPWCQEPLKLFFQRRRKENDMQESDPSPLG